MKQSSLTRALDAGLQLMPLLFLVATLLVFGTLSERFLTLDNLAAILVQSSWLIVAALGVNFVLLASGVDLSVGAIMYLAIAVVAVFFPALPTALWPIAVAFIGALAGACNAVLVARAQIPAFIVTLALAFVFRGAGLYLSDTEMMIAPDALAALGRAKIAGITPPLVLAALLAGASWLLLNKSVLGIYVRAIGTDRRGAERAGIPVGKIQLAVYCLSGAMAGLAGLLSFGQTSAATAAFGQNAEFLAIAAAVLGGTSLFGGRGGVWAPVVGGILIITVQNGLVMIDANPYAYPLVTGAVIFLAALLDSVRRRILARMNRPRILAAPAEPYDLPPSGEMA